MAAQRKVREDFDKLKEYGVDVSECTEKEKKEVQQAFFDVGIIWEYGGKEYKHLNATKYTNTQTDGVITSYCMFGYSTERCNMTAKEFLDLVYEPEQDVFLAHTLRITDSSGNTIYDLSARQAPHF